MIDLNMQVGEGGTMPSYAHDGDSGFDLYASEDVFIQGLRDVLNVAAAYGRDASTSKHWELVPTAIKVDIPEGYEIQIRSKSGLALKHGLAVLNSPGTIDAGYKGEIGVILVNNGHGYTVRQGQKIAQGVLVKVEKANLATVATDTERGDGGFGSTGLGA